ncbi:MAG TPA: glycosyl hydrolase [Gemmatimonadaceae bacterium]|nr:glycosyl hydrolase [Gemmatimonadaceae bacterium]
MLLAPCSTLLAPCSLLLIATVTAASFAQAQRAPARAVSTPAPDSAAFARQIRGLRWRSIGPYRGGRVGAVEGDPTKPLVFYFGAVNGGIWKTTNAGQSWTNITDGKSDISSVGAIAIAPSDPNVIYVGTGEKDLREDLTYGTGVYRTTDGGLTWVSLGLRETHQIGRIRIDPRNPDRVFVAAMGHAFGPNAERGVFRTSDGGKTWQKVLFVDDSTGAIDLTMDPTNPRILFAAMWKFQRTPWSMLSGGGKSGIWKSTDGGDTWKEITRNSGLPTVPLGRIGIDISRTNPRRVYASIEAKDTLGGIFRSDDGGENWEHVNGEQKLNVRMWYYSTLTADPTDENTVYVMNLTVWKSIDGGKTFTRIRVPHGDTHAMWVDPRDGSRLINGNDGGGSVSLDGGASWSSIYNQPTAQFYHVITDNQWPYRIYGAQQDNSTISIPSRSDNGSIDESDWFAVAGCENAHIAVDPRDPNITYGGCYMGALGRYDKRTGNYKDISVGLRNYDGYGAIDVPHRFQWTYPVVISQHDPTILYATSQHVWRSRDEGQSWERISPDLTVRDTTTLRRTGGLNGEMTGAEWYATIYAFAESPVRRGVLWAGSDDGLIHVSQDAGQTWQNVTPPNFGKFTRVSHIDPGRHDAGVAYVAANRYQQDDFAPYLWKTHDYGKTWTRINSGIPVGAYTRSLREDGVKRGLLFAATEIGVYVSFDDGASWRSLQLNLPRVSVRDLAVKDNDVVAATHGRSFWVLDDINVLRVLADSITNRSAYLYKPNKAVRFAGGGFPTRSAGENPPCCAVIDYWLREKPADPVKIEVLDANGAVVKTFSSASKPAPDSNRTTPPAPEVDSVAYYPADSVLHARQGGNRFVWNLRYPAATRIRNMVIDEGHTRGPVAPPGEYRVRLIVGRDSLTQPLTVVPDPRLKVAESDYQAQFALASRTVERINEIAESFNRIEDLQKQLDERVRQTSSQAFASRVKDAAKGVREKLEGVRREIAEVYSHTDQITLHYPVKLYNWFITLNAQVQDGDGAPAKQHNEIYSELAGKLGTQLNALAKIEDQDIAAFNRLLQELQVPGVYVPPRKPSAAM